MKYACNLPAADMINAAGGCYQHHASHFTTPDEGAMQANDTTARVEFRDIPNYPGYRVGCDGTVWSCWTNAGKTCSIWKQMTPMVDDRRRKSVKLCRGRVIKWKMVHRLVLEAFVGPCPDGMEACHFPDRDSSNCRLENLRWDTRVSNAADRVIHGTHRFGDTAGRAILTASDVIEIRNCSSGGESNRSLARRFGVGRTTIDAVVNRLTWKHVPAHAIKADWPLILKTLTIPAAAGATEGGRL